MKRLEKLKQLLNESSYLNENEYFEPIGDSDITYEYVVDMLEDMKENFYNSDVKKFLKDFDHLFGEVFGVDFAKVLTQTMDWYVSSESKPSIDKFKKGDFSRFREMLRDIHYIYTDFFNEEISKVKKPVDPSTIELLKDVFNPDELNEKSIGVLKKIIEEIRYRFF